MESPEVLNYKRNVTVGDLRMALPYSIGDLWILGDQVFECVSDSEKEINMNDWILAGEHKYVPELQ